MKLDFQEAKLIELEAVTGIQSEMWSRWFSGRYAISGKSLARAAKALNTSQATLIEQIELRKLQNKQRSLEKAAKALNVHHSKLIEQIELRKQKKNQESQATKTSQSSDLTYSSTCPTI